MNILYITGGDPNSHGNILKYYWQKNNLGKFHQISKPRPSGKDVDICLHVGEDNIVNEVTFDGNIIKVEDFRKILGNLYEKSDVIHFDRPRPNGLLNKSNKAYYISPIVRGKERDWLSLIMNEKKPCVFSFRGDELLRWYNQSKNAIQMIPHSIVVYSASYLRHYLSDDSMFLPYCGNEKEWSQVSPTNPDIFTVAHQSTSSKGLGYLEKRKNLPHIEDYNDFVGGPDAIGVINNVVSDLRKKGKKIRSDEIRGVSWRESFNRISSSSCLFHSFRAHGAYGWGAVEAMYYGKPILNGISKLFIDVMKWSPFLQTENVQQLKRNLLKIYNSEELYKEYSKLSTKFYNEYHKPRVVIKKYLLPIYRKAMEV